MMCVTALSIRSCLLYVSIAIHKKNSPEFSVKNFSKCVHPPLIVMCVTALSVRCCLLYVSIAIHKKISREFSVKNFSKNFTIMCTSAFNSDVCHHLKCPPLLALRFDCKPLNSAASQRYLLLLLLNRRVLCIYTSSTGFVQLVLSVLFNLLVC